MGKPDVVGKPDAGRGKRRDARERGPDSGKGAQGWCAPPSPGGWGDAGPDPSPGPRAAAGPPGSRGRERVSGQGRSGARRPREQRGIAVGLGGREHEPLGQSAPCSWGGTPRGAGTPGGAGAAAKASGSRRFGSQQKPLAALGRGAKRRVVPGRTNRRSAAAPHALRLQPSPGGERRHRTRLPIAPGPRGAAAEGQGDQRPPGSAPAPGEGRPRGLRRPRARSRGSSCPACEPAPPTAGTCLSGVSACVPRPVSQQRPRRLTQHPVRLQIPLQAPRKPGCSWKPSGR